MNFMIMVAGAYVNYLLTRFRKFFCERITICRSSHLMDNVFLERYTTELFKLASQNSILLAKVLTGLCVFALISLIFAGTATTYFFEESQYPLPFPMFLFGVRPSGLLLYLINWIHQTFAIVVAVDAYCSIVCLALIFAVYILARFDAIMELTENVNAIVAESSFDEYCRLVVDLMIDVREYVNLLHLKSGQY